MPACINCYRYNAESRKCTVSEGSPIRKCVIALLEKECANMRGKVLEIGCGGWDLAKQLLQAQGCEYYGVDPILSDEKGRPSVATHRGTVSSLPFENSFFDWVLGSQTLEHWQEWDTPFPTGFREVYRVLKPGGILSLNVPIHLHGHLMFVRGDMKRILALFNRCLWESVKHEAWRREYEPLEPFTGWRLAGFDDSVVAASKQREPSSWILQIKATKHGNLKPWAVRLWQTLEFLL